MDKVDRVGLEGESSDVCAYDIERRVGGVLGEAEGFAKHVGREFECYDESARSGHAAREKPRAAAEVEGEGSGGGWEPGSSSRARK
jgi:hypothetical protein